MNLVLRLLKRKLSLSLGSTKEMIDAEFSASGRFDPHLSVFEVLDEEGHIVRARAEFDASWINPKTDEDRLAVSFHGIDNLDIDGDDPGKTRFVFTQRAHRTIEFVEEEEIVEAVEALRADLQARTRTVSPDAIKAYVAERLLAKDDEWLSLCEEKRRWRNWALGSPRLTEPPKDAPGAHADIE